ncbi:hypothetical protein V6N13_126048 [Hibiscus sabdariffa]
MIRGNPREYGGRQNSKGNRDNGDERVEREQGKQKGVVNVYIARKHSKGGKRFGFVRMNGKEDADRVIERLAGRNKEKGEEISCKEWGKYVNQRMKEDGATRESGGLSNLIEALEVG